MFNLNYLFLIFNCSAPLAFMVNKDLILFNCFGVVVKCSVDRLTKPYFSVNLKSFLAGKLRIILRI